MIGTEPGDGLQGERIVCRGRRMRGPWLVAGTGSHRAIRLVLEGLPAEAWIEKPMRVSVSRAQAERVLRDGARFLEWDRRTVRPER